MPLSPNILAKLIQAQCAGKGIIGKDMTNFSTAFAKGLITSFKSMNQVMTMDTGVMTSGTGIGKLTGLSPDILAKLTAGMLASNQIIGSNMKDLAEAVSKATVTHFLATNQVNTSHTTVALGSGVGKVMGLTPAAMEAKIMGEMSSVGFKGTSLAPLVSAFSKAFCSHVMAMGIVNVAITGCPAPITPAGPIPSAGVGKGKVS